MSGWVASLVGGGATLPMPTATVLLILLRESLISRFGRSCQEVLALAAGFLFFFFFLFLLGGSYQLDLHGLAVQRNSVVCCLSCNYNNSLWEWHITPPLVVTFNSVWSAAVNDFSRTQTVIWTCFLRTSLVARVELLGLCSLSVRIIPDVLQQPWEDVSKLRNLVAEDSTPVLQ